MNRTRPILGRLYRPVLQSFAGSDLLLAFDYDGTLSPIAPTPARARVRARTRRLLATVAQLYPCAVISGRMLADITARLAGIPIQHVFGNHGLESSDTRSPRNPRVRRWLALLRRQLADQRGIVIEDKQYSLTVHYRAASDRRQSVAAIRRAVHSLKDVRIIDGSETVNLLPRRGSDKGVALRRALKRSGCRTVLYIGDEQTDEDAFAALGPDRLLAIRVGPSRASHARYHLDSQEAIDDLLAFLAEARVARDESDRRRRGRR